MLNLAEGITTDLTGDKSNLGFRVKKHSKIKHIIVSLCMVNLAVGTATLNKGHCVTT